MRLALALLAVLLSWPLVAQEKPTLPQAAPTLTEADTLRIRTFELTLENLTLRLKTAESEARAFLATLQKPGFVLQRQDDGSWRYQPVPPEKKD
jgi:hypothetical protein